MVLEVSNDESLSESFIKIKVERRIEPYASFVNYEINIETNDPSFTFEKSTTRRRYSEFRTLHAMLVKQFRHINVPELPPKAPFKSTFNMDFVEQRRTKLEELLAKLLSKKIFLSSRAFHLFLQSTCPMTEIKDIVTGKSTYVDVNWPGIVNESVSQLNDEAEKSSSDEESGASCSVPVTSFATSSNSSPASKRDPQLSVKDHVNKLQDPIKPESCNVDFEIPSSLLILWLNQLYMIVFCIVSSIRGEFSEHS